MAWSEWKKFGGSGKIVCEKKMSISGGSAMSFTIDTDYPLYILAQVTNVNAINEGDILDGMLFCNNAIGFAIFSKELAIQMGRLSTADSDANDKLFYNSGTSTYYTTKYLSGNSYNMALFHIE